jgi:hypothetical protein
MKRSRFSEEPVIAILREHEAGLKTAELCRKHDVAFGWAGADRLICDGWLDTTARTPAATRRRRT